MFFEATSANRRARHLLGLSMVAAALSATLVGKAAAPAGRYTISAGIVYDTKTKLAWEQAPAPSTYALSSAQAYCSSLNLGGTGWRLPTTKELETIVDPTVSGPAIDPSAFPGTPSDYFWTATPYAPQAGSGWLVYFTDGSLAFVQTTYVTNVRCVR